MSISLLDALQTMSRDGYCLWVGAGVTMHLARAGGISAPSWPELVEKLEADSGIDPATTRSKSFPKRLDGCLSKLGEAQFQQRLREHIDDPLRNAITNLARKATGSNFVPREVRQLAHLGALANPIVSFNIEARTSRLLASPTGRYTIRAFNPAAHTDKQKNIARSHGGTGDSPFSRTVYHPHGALDLYGLCVMTDSQYKSMKGTLAYQLATHSAFESHLAIVGMSLDDAYLRKQIKAFRHHIDAVLWFVNQAPSPKVADWARSNDIHVVQENWKTFWEAVEDQLPRPSEDPLTLSWYNEGDRAFAGPRSMAELAARLGPDVQGFAADSDKRRGVPHGAGSGTPPNHPDRTAFFKAYGEATTGIT